MPVQATYADPETIRVYDEAAPKIAAHMSTIGSRVTEIDNAFALAGSPRSAYVLEIGCGDGRDAVDIALRSSFYEGIDPSRGLIALADLRGIDKAIFEIADALSYDYGQDYDVIFAFASLHHLDYEDLRRAFQRIAPTLARNGILHITMKGADEHETDIKNDRWDMGNGTIVTGKRTFYHYTMQEVLDLADGVFRLADAPTDKVINGIRWLTFDFARA